MYIRSQGSVTVGLEDYILVMHFFKTVAVVTALASGASAHGSVGLPEIMGLDLLDRRAEILINSLAARDHISHHDHDKSVLEGRKDDRECGEGIGSCPQDKCCSISGCA